MRNYLSFGGGVNSVALHLLMLDQGVEFESVFVHHGTDWPETYHYVAMFQWWLKSQGHKPITVLRPKKFHSLIDECEKYSIVPAQYPRWCTAKYKVEILYRYFKTPCFVNLGIDYGESKRAKISTESGIENRWPLIEHEIDRDGCKKIIESHGLPIPMKSGCYICPFQKKEQWVELRRKHPCLFRRAVDLEKANMEYRASKGKKPMFLSPSKKSLETIVDENQTSMLEEDQYPPCQCGL